MERWREIAEKLLEPNKLDDFPMIRGELEAVDKMCRKIEGHKLISVQVVASIIHRHYWTSWVLNSTKKME